MTNTMTHKGYSARIGYDDGDGVFTGRIAASAMVSAFTPNNVDALSEAFHGAVED